MSTMKISDSNRACNDYGRACYKLRSIYEIYANLNPFIHQLHKKNYDNKFDFIKSAPGTLNLSIFSAYKFHLHDVSLANKM